MDYILFCVYFIFSLINFFFSSVCDKGLTDCELFLDITLITLLKSIEFL